jgi:threonyl-tRNA synthetase
MINITLPDGSIRSFEENLTVLDVAKDISEGFARNVISAKFNDSTVETSTLLTSDGNLTLYTWRDDAGKKAFWHSSAHILAQALEELYPGVKLSIGPAIENGFYYDVDLGDQVISDKDFKRIEDKMIEIARGKHEFSIKPVSKADALSKYKKENNEYK